MTRRNLQTAGDVTCRADEADTTAKTTKLRNKDFMAVVITTVDASEAIECRKLEPGGKFGKFL